jgi:hypothetical protein
MGQRLARLSLEPVEIPGPWWRRHRSWLTTPAPFAGTGTIVVNMRTGVTYDWHFRGNRRGRGWFGVRTRWTWFHPAWKCDPWVLFYDAPTVGNHPSRSA